MKIIIKARHMPLTSSLDAYAQDKLGQAVVRLMDGSAVRLDIELSQTGHARDGRSLRCRAVVSVPHGRQLVVSLSDDDMYRAIDRVHDALMMAVKREVRRHNDQALARRLARRRRPDRMGELWPSVAGRPAYA